MNAQYRLKEDWKPVGSSKMWKMLTDWMNSVAKQLNRAEVVSGGTARPTDLGFRIEVDGGDAEPWAFQCSIVSPVVTITPGTIRLSDANYEITAPTDVTLTGATEYVYVYLMKSGSGTGTGHSSTNPVSNGDKWIFPLAKYTATAGVWTLSQILHRGDVNVVQPLR